MYISNFSWEGLGPNQPVTVGMATSAGQTYAPYRVSVVYPTTADFKAKTVAQIEADALAQFQQDYPNLGT
jgi:hypothetical protein